MEFVKSSMWLEESRPRPVVQLTVVSVVCLWVCRETWGVLGTLSDVERRDAAVLIEKNKFNKIKKMILLWVRSHLLRPHYISDQRHDPLSMPSGVFRIQVTGTKFLLVHRTPSLPSTETPRHQSSDSGGPYRDR